MANSNNFINWLTILVILASSVVVPVIFDSFTTPKLWILSAGCLGLVVYSLQLRLKSNEIKLPTGLKIILIFLMLAILVSQFSSELPIARSFFGQFGRGNGIYYYFLCITVLVLAASYSRNIDQLKIHKYLVYFSWFISIYAFLQFVGIDLGQRTGAGTSNVTVTLGNPDFAGGLIAMLFTYNFIYSVIRNKWAPGQFLLLGALLIAAKLSGAVQGYFIILVAVLVGSSIVLLRNRKQLWVKLVLLAGWSLGIILILLGLAGRSLLNTFFSRQSFQARIEYWRITLRIIHDYPLFGIGSDNLFGVTSKYMSPGSLNMITTTRMDAAHNWFLNFAVCFGLVAAFFLLVLIGWTLIAGAKSINWGTLENQVIISIYFAFISLLIDSTVSIEQPGLGIWLYFFGGLILGQHFSKNEIPSRRDENQENSEKFLSNLFMRKVQVSAILLLVGTIILISNRIIQDGILRANLQKTMVQAPTQATLRNIFNSSSRLKEEPEYAFKALNVYSNIGDSKNLDTLSKVFYDYSPHSIQAVLIRSKILIALNRFGESCPLTLLILENTPWDDDSLEQYLACSIMGVKDSNETKTLALVLPYLPSFHTEEEIVNEARVANLNIIFKDTVFRSMIFKLLGKDNMSITETNKARTILTKLQLMESGIENYVLPTDRDLIVRMLKSL